MNEILTVQEVADYLRLSRTTVWRWCNDGKLPAFKVGRGWRIPRSEVEKMLAQSLTGQEGIGQEGIEYEQTDLQRQPA